jgi:hypothetical protein
MNEEKFKSIIEITEKINKNCSSLHSLGVDLMDYNDSYHKIIRLLMSSIFKEEGMDWIDWYLYERPSFKGTDNHAWDENGNPICYDIPSLWETVKEYLKN